MTDEHPTTVCPNCGNEFSLLSAATPCPSCGKMFHRITQAATAKGMASMSKTVGKTVSATAKGYPDMEARG